MFKGIARSLGQTEQKSIITLKVTKVGTQVEEDCQVQVVWKRGAKETQEGALVDLNNIEVDSDLKDVFIKDSSFYKSGEVWQPKYCEFQLKMVNEFGTSTYA